MNIIFLSLGEKMPFYDKLGRRNQKKNFHLEMFLHHAFVVKLCKDRDTWSEECRGPLWAVPITITTVLLNHRHQAVAIGIPLRPTA